MPFRVNGRFITPPPEPTPAPAPAVPAAESGHVCGPCRSAAAVWRRALAVQGRLPGGPQANAAVLAETESPQARERRAFWEKIHARVAADAPIKI